MPLRIYLNENANTAIATGLRQRGIDAWSARDVGNRDLTDEQQLEYATNEHAVIFTHDGDFLRISDAWKEQGREHRGNIFVRARRFSIGESVRRLAEYAEALDPEDMKNAVEFL